MNKQVVSYSHKKQTNIADNDFIRVAATLTIHVIACCIFLGKNAFADAPSIGGSVNITVSAESVTNTALAANSVAQVVVGSFNSGNSSGGFNAVVSAGTIINTATGSGSCSQIVLGSVGANNCGE